MTMQSPPYALQAGSHSAELFRRAISTLIGSAGGIVGSGDLQITQNGTPNMSVNCAGGVPGGEIWVPGTSVAGVQGSYYCMNDATGNLPIAASNPTNPRIDIAVAQVQDAAYAGASNNCQLAIVTGTPAGSPVAPSAPASSLVLANIAVAANATTVVTANITDKRAVVKAGSMAEPAFATYKDLGLVGFAMVGGGTASQTIAAPAVPPVGTTSFVGLTAGAASAFYLDPGDYAAGTRVVKVRLRVGYGVNSTSPGGGITLTAILVPIATWSFGAASSGPTIASIGAAVASAVVPTTASAASAVAGADATLSAAGWYALGVTISGGTTAANSGFSLDIRVQMRQV